MEASVMWKEGGEEKARVVVIRAGTANDALV